MAGQAPEPSAHRVRPGVRPPTTHLRHHASCRASDGDHERSPPRHPGPHRCPPPSDARQQP